MLNIRSFSFFIALSLCTTISFAQVKTIKRIEFELKEGYSNHQFSKFGDNGIILFSKFDETIGDNSRWKIERYSTDLELSKTETVNIPRGQRLNETFENESHLFLFFKSKKGDYSIVKIEAKTLMIETKKGILPKKMWPREFKIIDNTAFITGRVKKESIVFTVNLENGENNLRPISVKGFKSSKLNIENVQIQEKSKELFVYINAFVKKEHDVHVVRYDNNGEKQESFNLTSDIDQKLTSISASYISDVEYVYTGTYSDKSSSSSKGVYICKTKNGEKEFISFYKFLDFKEFLSYLPEKKQAKIEKKKKKKEKKGKELKLSYLIASHDIIVTEDKYIFIGEAFYPTYRTETYYTTDANGRTVAHTRTVFDGYQYTHATIAAFDKKGNKIWDQTFKMYPNYKPFYAKKFISVSTEKDNIDMLFSSRSGVHAMSFSRDGKIMNEKSYDIIETGDENDKIKSSYTNMDYWYGEYFLTHGYQKIKNKENKKQKGQKKKRKIYFINKLSYE